MDLAPGMTIGSYLILEQIGRGGMAAVYRARHPRLDRRVAIKVVLPFLAQESGFLSRFEREATTVAKLRHPHILTIYDFGEDHGTAYLVTELLEGGDLSRRLGIQRTVAETVSTLGPIASALDYAHEHHVLHRDVKPSNILLGRDGKSVLGDFGIAKMTDASLALTKTGALVGTPLYQAPEQAQGSPASPATDQYALAVVAYEMLTGRVPFSAETPAAVLLAHMVTPPPPPRSLNPGMDAQVERALLIGLAKAPDERYPTASAFVSALAAAGGVAASDAGRALPTGPGAGWTPAPTPAPDVRSSASMERSGHEPPLARRSGRAWLAKVAAVAALSGAAAALALLWHVAAAARPVEIVGSLGSPWRVAWAKAVPASVLLADDFRNEASGKLPHASSDPTHAVLKYVGGEYLVETIDPQTVVTTAYLPGVYADAAIDVGVRVDGDPDGRYVAVGCRQNPEREESFYRAAIAPSTGTFLIDGQTDGSPFVLVPWTTSDAIRRNDEVNHLRLRCAQRTIALEINGHPVASMQDAKLASGRLWLEVGALPYRRVAQAARFRDLVVTKA